MLSLDGTAGMDAFMNNKVNTLEEKKALFPVWAPCQLGGFGFCKTFACMSVHLPQGLPVIQIEHLNLRNGLH